MKSFRDLRVWKSAIDLAVSIYSVSTTFPSQERYGLCAQLRKASISIASNIAEGQGRLTLGEWRQFLGHARGSLYEVETQLLIASRLGFLDDTTFESLTADASALGKGLSRLLDYVTSRQKGSS